MQTALAQPKPSASLESFASSIPGRILFALAATVVVAIASHIAIPLPFTPVPLTMQPLAVMGVGLALGPVTGFLAMVAYLAEGAAGLPVFSPTGLGGTLQLFGPTGGYLLAYPLVAAICGGLVRFIQARMTRFSAALLACTASMIVLYAIGAEWLTQFGHLTLQQAWIAGVAPFLPGEAVKVLAASGIYSTLTRQAHK